MSSHGFHFLSDWYCSCSVHSVHEYWVYMSIIVVFQIVSKLKSEKDSLEDDLKSQRSSTGTRYIIIYTVVIYVY